MRNALAHVSKGQHTVVAAAIRQAFDQPDRAHAGETWRKVAEQALAALRQAEQQPYGKARAATQQQPGQGALQAQVQGLGQRAILQPGVQAAQHIQW